MSTFKQKSSPRAIQTRLLHEPTVDATGFASLSMPEYRGSSTFFTNTAAQQAHVDGLGLDYSYGLHGNPTQYTLASRLALIEGAEHALVCPSGLAAIMLVAHGCLSKGDHWVIPANAYGPALAIANDLAVTLGVSFSVYDPIDLTSLEDAIQTNTRLIWVEAPGSLTFETPDLQRLVELGRQLAPQAALGIDNTYSAGLAYKPFEQGFDYSVQALTKYQCGHADVLMGAVLSNNKQAFAKVERKNRLYGLGVSPTDCALVLRGLLTLTLRYEKQAASALDLAHWLQEQPQVATVLHPSLAGTPGHQHFRQNFSSPNSLFSIALKASNTQAQAARLVDSLKLFRIAYSWGGPESLALVVNLPEERHRRLALQVEQAGGCKASDLGPLIRLAIGLEAPDDLKADLEQALTVL